jgi:hypothetical protein
MHPTMLWKGAWTSGGTDDYVGAPAVSGPEYIAGRTTSMGLGYKVSKVSPDVVRGVTCEEATDMPD